MVTRDVPENLFEMMISIDPVIRPLIPMFLEQTLLRIHSMDEALQKMEFATIKKVAHTMKGSSSSYGFAQMADIARAIEGILQTDNVDADLLGIQISKLFDLHESAANVVAANKQIFQDDQE